MLYVETNKYFIGIDYDTYEAQQKKNDHIIVKYR